LTKEEIMNNQEIIKKADMVLSDLATAGRLNPEQTDRFIRVLMESPTILQNCRTVAMNAPTMKLNKLGFGSRILQPAVSATALISSARSKPDLSQVVLNTSEVIAEIRLPYDVIEDNIERGNIGGALQTGAGGFHQTIVDMIAERAALDLEEMAILGDSASGDPYLALQNGFLKLSTTNVVAAGSVAFSKATVKAALKTMPPKYLRNRASLVHFVSVNNETEIRDQYGARATAAGDANLQQILPVGIYGSRVMGVPLMPNTQSLFTDPMNLIFGIQRNIQIEYTKDISARVFVIVLTSRVAFQIEETNAVVKTTGLLP
jgi:hypothetical protein